MPATPTPLIGARERTLDEARAHCAREVAALPTGLRGLEPAQSPLPVHVSVRLPGMQAELRRRHC